MIALNRSRRLDLGQRMPVWIVSLSDGNDVSANGDDESQSPEFADCPEFARYSCQLSCDGGAGCERGRTSSLPNALSLVPMHRRDGVAFHARHPQNGVAPRPIPSPTFPYDLVRTVLRFDMPQLMHCDRIGDNGSDTRCADKFKFAADCQRLRRSVTPFDIDLFLGAEA